MAGKKKFGAFAGVFTPSILTILGVIMYMRMGWVVGNAGLIGTLIIIIIAHVISIATGLSISSIATDKKVGAGGIYYILSRSMGIPMGGAIGITLYVGTAFSIALYLIGFAESFNGYFGFDTSINGLRMTGFIALLALTAIALISTSFALKTQFIILAAIVVSLVSIFFGTHEFAPEITNSFSSGGSVPLEVVFAIFFPAVTGFTAGIAMSGDLKDPKKDIPVGTISAIAVGFVVYIALAFFLFYYIDGETLRTDYNILMKIALFAPAVVAGIWGATLSSALGGILGGPRILQAMSLDKITPRFFGKGRGKNNEPVNALLLVFVIAFSGILIGELDVIARVVSMFYLAAYGVINLSFFLESWANPDFQPTFKVKRWIGLIGFIASFAVMFKLDMIAMFGAIVIIFGIYFWLQRKQIALESGDVWQSVWENIVAKGLKRLDAKEIDTSNNWNPNIILFSGESGHRSYLLELSNTLSGRTGVVTNFSLILDKKDKKPLTKTEQIVKDSNFEKLGIFGRQVKVDNIFRGIENIASTFGFSGIEPNTIMMGWPRELSDSGDYSTMTQNLLHLDYNLLYLDFDRKAKFGNYKTVDLWWRETDSKNAEMMLNIARFILQSQEWADASIRVLFVNHNNIDSNIIKSKIGKLVKDLRVDVAIKILNNGVEQKPFYDIIALQSANTDLTLVGIPNIKTEKQAEFIVNTNQLFKTIGSTLMVKASNNFNEIELDLSQESAVTKEKASELNVLPTNKSTILNKKVLELDSVLSLSLNKLSEPALSTIASFYVQFVASVSKELETLTAKLASDTQITDSIRNLQVFLNKLISLSKNFKEEKLLIASEALDKGVNGLLNNREEFLHNALKTVNISNTKKKQNLKWRAILDYYFSDKILPNTQESLYNFGTKNFLLLNTLTEGIVKESQLYIERLTLADTDALSNFSNSTNDLLQSLKTESLSLKNTTIGALRNFDRDICIELLAQIDKPNFYTSFKKKFTKDVRKRALVYRRNMFSFAKNWYNNQVLSHNQAETGWHLSGTGLGLAHVNESIKTHLTSSLINPQQRKLLRLSRVIKTLNQSEDRTLDARIVNDVNEIAEGVSHANLSNLFEEEEQHIITISQDAPKSVDLLSSESFNRLNKQQDEDIEQIKINLSSIQNHVIQKHYLATLQDSLHALEKSYNQNSEGIYNTANRILHLLGELESKSDENENDILTMEVEKDLNLNQENITKLNDSFFLDLKTNLHNTQDNLDIRTIIDSSELLSKAAQKPIIKSKFQEWNTQKKEAFKQKRKKLTSLIIKRKQEIDSLKFDKTHNQYINRIEQTHRFIETQEVSASVEKAIPFYYMKLFTGSHLSNTRLTKKPEFKSAQDALSRIGSGVSGALMIVGDSLSGKSFFCEAIAKIPSNYDKFDVNPPDIQEYTAKDLHAAFQKLFQKKGTSLAILRRQKPSIFIFNDMERWWTRSEHGNKTLNYLAQLIERVGDKHYFILNANIHSFRIIKETTQIEQQLLATIMMRPIDKMELKTIIINRHKIGGASVHYKDEVIENSKKVTSLIHEIHTLSNGSIGMALQLWLNSISIDDDNTLRLEKVQEGKFPEIHNAEWKLLLYQFILHKSLSKNQLKLLFKEDIKWVIDSLKEMEKSGLVFKQANTKYRLNSTARYYIEKRLKNLSILK